MKKQHAAQNAFVGIICALLIVLFIYTGLNKLMDYSEFTFQIGRSPFIQHMAPMLSVSLPAGELLVALALIFPQTRLPGLYLSFFLMGLFTGYVWIMLHYAYDLPCSCGGVLAAMSWQDHLVFNAAFTLLAMLGVVLQSNLRRKKDGLRRRNSRESRST